MKWGRITIITGSPGTGKSTAAEKVSLDSDMEKSVCLRTDDFYHYLKKGYIPPYLPASNDQNGIVIESFLEAAKRFVRGGYDVYVDGIVGPWFIEPWLKAVREGYEVNYIVLRHQSSNYKYLNSVHLPLFLHPNHNNHGMYMS